MSFNVIPKTQRISLTSFSGHFTAGNPLARISHRQLHRQAICVSYSFLTTSLCNVCDVYEKSMKLTDKSVQKQPRRNILTCRDSWDDNSIIVHFEPTSTKFFLQSPEYILNKIWYSAKLNLKIFIFFIFCIFCVHYVCKTALHIFH